MPDPGTLRRAVWQRLETRQEALLELCRELVRIPSVNGEHSEAGVAEAVARHLEAAGLSPRRLAFQAGRPNVLAEVGQGEPGLLFLAHLDTVAVGDATHWRHDPFGAQIAGGRLYGRGACDNKAGLAVAAVLLAVLAEFAQDLRGRVLLAGVPDEESGASGRLGILPLLQGGHLRASQAVYTYPGLDLLAIGHRGLLRARVRARGRSAHTGGEGWERGTEGANAVTAMAELLLALEAWRPDHVPSPAFPGRRPVVTPGTLLRGGSMESMVPDACQAVIDVRLLPGQTPEGLLEAVRARAADVAAGRPGIAFELEPLVRIPAVTIPPETPIVGSLAGWTERLTGRRPALVGAGPANEGYLLIRAGIPTVCGFGPPGGNAHAANEYVELAGLLLTARIYAAAVLDQVAA